ncbi:ATP-binding protein [Candidatus Uhrbacteria bacterium]|nr:ATP-binding protein [Candidatus Uhrbacteria bacterium]
MPSKNKQLVRYLESRLARLVREKKSFLLLGPRQVGKTTLVRSLLASRENVLEYTLQDPSVRITLEQDPSRIIREARAHGVRPLVFIDEAQKVPELFDATQVLLDNREASCIFTGSSARKLRRAGANLLPGRIQRLFLDPLLWGELGLMRHPALSEFALKNINAHGSYSFEDLLIYGSLPLMVSLTPNERKDILKSYAQLYLEEEIRAEAIVRKIGAFSRFLELAAVESGTAPNLSKLSQESGVSQPSIKEFYQILEDTLVVERIDPYLKNARKRILASSRYYFFDLGVRNALARIPLERDVINTQKGTLFEHAVILEIIRRNRLLQKPHTIHYWRTSGGAEVDCVVDTGSSVIPIEIKAGKSVRLSEIKGLRIFLEEYRRVAPVGYVITQGERRERLDERITAVPWFDL